MADNSGSATTAGILTGVLFTATSLIPNSHAYPLLVPFLGGGLAAFLARGTSPLGAGRGAKLGAKAGAIGGLILVLVGAPLTYLLAGPAIRERLQTAGAALPQEGLLALLLGLLVIAVIGVVLAVVGGVIAALAFGRR